MRLIRPSAELWIQGNSISDIWSHIARCVRVCYQSTPKNENEDDKSFVKRVILRNDPLWSEANHLAMLEHGTIYLTVVHDAADEFEMCSFYKSNRFSVMTCTAVDGGMNHYITTNFRVLIEADRISDLAYLTPPTEHHERRYTISFITNLGVSREFNRHRVNSIAEESTRYCNYSKDKFGNEVTFAVPTWYSGPLGKVTLGVQPYAYDEENKEWKLTLQEYFYLNSLFEAEDNYFCLTRMGWIPQQAREVLPLATKTQLVHTAFEHDWKHFIALRSKGVSGAPHPNAKELGDQVAELLKDKLS